MNEAFKHSFRFGGLVWFLLLFVARMDIFLFVPIEDERAIRVFYKDTCQERT